MNVEEFNTKTRSYEDEFEWDRDCLIFLVSDSWLKI